MAYKLLLVDDDRENLMVNKALLSEAGYSVTTASSGIEALERIAKAKNDFALILMDYHMPGMNGAETVQKIKWARPNQQILAFSLDDTREVMRETFKAGVADFLDKNTENEILLSVVASYCVKYEHLFRPIEHDEQRDGREQFILETGMTGKSENLFELCRELRKIAPTTATTLILGESGTGKELVAQALHKFSDRAKGPFVAINVAAEPANLLDSALFGHRKGAFTGAIVDHPGKFKLADKGTIFLDEIGDLSLDLQVKFLRVLQEREINPVGSSKPISIDVRIVAATHKNLLKMVADGTFREDLYYRLSSVVISTTPLRERTEDIEPLVAHFTTQICKENGFSKFFHRRCLEILRAYRWKGNVRELRSVVERHLVKSDAASIRPEDLDASLYETPQVSVPTTMKEIDQHLENVKKSLVAEALKAGSPAEVSRKLGISQNHLSYFIDKWGLRKQ